MTHLEQIDKVLNKLYEDNALGTIPQDRYEQMSQKYSEDISRFENELTQLAEPTEQEIQQMREEIEEGKKEKSCAYHREYSREY